MDKEDFGPHRRIGFMTGAMKLPADFDAMGREEIEAAFTASDPRLSPAVRLEKPARPEKPGNWDGLTQALAVTEVPSSFLSPQDRQQGIHFRDPFGDGLAHDSTPDDCVGMDVAGMAWWNGLSEPDRRYWCLAAMTAVPAQAWKYFRLVTAPRRPVKINHCD